jgi:hypothetical protein
MRKRMALRMIALIIKKENETAFDILIFCFVFLESASISASRVPFIQNSSNVK